MGRTWGAWPGGAARGWLLLGLALVGFIVLAAIDQDLKEPPHGGFCPDGASITVSSASWPAFWGGVDSTDVGRAAAESLAELTYKAGLPVLRRTGVRPTPARWRLWLGPTLLAGWQGEGKWGVCVHPGVLARFAHGLNRVLTGQMGVQAVYRLGRGPGRDAGVPIYYAWRDGFLMFSPGAGYLRAARDASSWQGESEAPEHLVLAWRGQSPVRISLAPSDGLPARVLLAAPFGAEPGLLRLPDAWPDAPMLAVSAGSWSHARALARAVGSVLPRGTSEALSERFLPLAGEAWDFSRLTDGWADGLAECAFAVHMGEGGPNVAVALRRRDAGEQSEHPLLAAVSPEERIPTAWGPGALGVLAPRLGERWVMCLDEEPAMNLWLATTSEASMARLRGRIAPGEGMLADYAFLVRWPVAGQALADLLRALVRSELVLGWGGEDWAGVAETLETIAPHLGTARLVGKSDGREVVFEGPLAELGTAVPVSYTHLTLPTN